MEISTERNASVERWKCCNVEKVSLAIYFCSSIHTSFSKDVASPYLKIAQSVRAAEYSDWTSTKELYPPPIWVLDITLNNLMAGFQQCWGFGEYGVPLHCQRIKMKNRIRRDENEKKKKRLVQWKRTKRGKENIKERKERKNIWVKGRKWKTRRQKRKKEKGKWFQVLLSNNNTYI